MSMIYSHPPLRRADNSREGLIATSFPFSLCKSKTLFALDSHKILVATHEETRNPAGIQTPKRQLWRPVALRISTTTGLPCPTDFSKGHGRGAPLLTRKLSGHSILNSERQRLIRAVSGRKNSFGARHELDPIGLPISDFIKVNLNKTEAKSMAATIHAET